MGALLVFDLDGTLVDTAPDLLATLDVVLDEAGFRPVPHHEARLMIGHGARRMIERALAAQDASLRHEELEALYRRFLIHYEAHICVGSRPYPGAVEALDRFATAGWRFAVCTNKQERLSRLLLAALGLEARFAAVCGGDSLGVSKPEAGHLIGTIARAGHQPQRALMVGDARTDVDAARAAGVPVIGVTFGYTPVPMARLGPDLLIDHFDELSVAAAAGLLAGRPAAPAARAKPLPVQAASRSAPS